MHVGPCKFFQTVRLSVLNPLLCVAKTAEKDPHLEENSHSSDVSPLLYCGVETVKVI